MKRILMLNLVLIAVAFTALLIFSTAPTIAGASTEPVVTGLSCPESLGAPNTWAERYLRLVQMGVSLKILSVADVDSLTQLTRAGSPLTSRVDLPGTLALREAFNRLVGGHPSGQGWRGVQLKLNELVRNLRTRMGEQIDTREKTLADLITVKDFPLSRNDFPQAQLLQTPQGRVLFVTYRISVGAVQPSFAIYAPLESPEPIFEGSLTDFGIHASPHITPQGELLVAAYDHNADHFFVYSPLKSTIPRLRFPTTSGLQGNPIQWLSTRNGRTFLSVGERDVLHVFEPLAADQPIWSSESYTSLTSSQMFEGADGTVYVYAKNDSSPTSPQRDLGYLLFAVGDKRAHIWKHPMHKPRGPLAMMAVAPGKTLLVEASHDLGLRILWVEKGFVEYRKYEAGPGLAEYQLEFIRVGERALLMFQTSGKIYLFEPTKSAKEIFYAKGDHEKSVGLAKWQISAKGDLFFARRMAASMGTVAYTQIFQPLEGDDPIWVGEEHNQTPSFEPSFVHLSGGEFDRLMVFAPETDDDTNAQPLRVFDPKSGVEPFPIPGQPRLTVSAQTILNHKPNSTLIFYKTSDGLRGFREYTSEGER